MDYRIDSTLSTSPHASHADARSHASCAAATRPMHPASSDPPKDSGSRGWWRPGSDRSCRGKKKAGGVAAGFEQRREKKKGSIMRAFAAVIPYSIMLLHVA